MDSKSSEIKVLKPEVVAKIAAGEVVEKPASVVKELIENSIDADATNIVIKVKQAGKELIEVTDNGVGMDRSNAKLAFTQHATSKIINETDLENIVTLGFRGEALSSIAAVANISMQTSKNNKATQVNIISDQMEIGEGTITHGTRIQIKNLFGNIPARKKFLRSDATEYKHIVDIFQRHAVTHPQISFELHHNDKKIYKLPTTKNIKTRIFDIWGKKIAENSHEINFKLPKIEISGALGHPQIARKDRSRQLISLNNRPINSNLISKAIEDAYLSTKPDINHPIFFINIDLNPQEVDINVHPRKMEVKFSDTRSIYLSVKRAAERVLEDLLQNTVKQSFGHRTTNARHYNPKSKPDFLKEKILDYTPSQTKIDQSMRFSKALVNSSKSNQEVVEDYKFAQFFNTVVIVEREEKLLFIDQHAADERIKYESLMEKIEEKQSIPKQPMLIAETIELEPTEFEIIQENLKSFEKIGLEIEPFGDRTIKVNALPSIMSKFNFEPFIKEVLQRDIIELDPKEMTHKLVSTMACHSSIRAGMRLTDQEIRQMIRQLFQCKQPYSCPHGRPIIWEMKKYDIEKNFKRTGFC